MNHLYLRVIVPLAITLPLFFAVINLKRLSVSDKILLRYLLLSFVVNIVVAIMSANRINNLPLLHIFTWVELTILLFFYKNILEAKKAYRQYNMFISVFGLLCIINAIFFQSIYNYNTYTRSLEAIIMMLFSVNYFAKVFAENITQKTTVLPAFWFNTGIFLYFSWSFIFFTFSNVIAKQSTSNSIFLWYVHASFVLVMYMLFAVGFLKAGQQHRPLPSSSLLKSSI